MPLPGSGGRQGPGTGGTGRLVDGSRHDWLEGSGPYLTLVGGIDDATGLVVGGTFRAQEDAQWYFQMLRQVVGRGVPLAVYLDPHGIFVKTSKQEPSLEEQLAGAAPADPDGEAAGGDAGEADHGPLAQAKGRIERLWGTFHDRLASELRLRGVATLEEANLLLAEHLVRHHCRLAIPAQDPQPVWCKRSRELE